MSPRPRTIDDAEILMAAQRVMQRVGPANFTLQRVSDEAGLAPATLIQRFGSKRQLLRALSDSAPGHSAAIVAAMREQHDSPLAVAREFLLCFAEMARTPKEMAHHLAYFQLDLTDPVMHRNLVRMSREHVDTVAALLDEAVQTGELVPHDTKRRAHLLHTVASGGLLTWATFRAGTARDWIARDLDDVLTPLRVAPKRSSKHQKALKQPGPLSGRR